MFQVFVFFIVFFSVFKTTVLLSVASFSESMILNARERQHSSLTMTFENILWKIMFHKMVIEEWNLNRCWVNSKGKYFEYNLTQNLRKHTENNFLRRDLRWMKTEYPMNIIYTADLKNCIRHYDFWNKNCSNNTNLRQSLELIWWNWNTQHTL